MPEIPDPEIVFEGVKPQAAIDYWKSLSLMTGEQARKLDAGARSRAYYVSCLKEMDEIALVHTASLEALENGSTFPVFKERLASLGMPDHLLKTIFTTNLQTAYAAGRYAKMQAVKGTRPYWRYITIGDNRVRPSHAVLSGMVFPADHPFWNENHPPNGYRCRCGVQSLSERQVKREKLKVQKEMPGDMMWTDPKTGMEYHVARPGADDGFRNNPGKDWFAGLHPEEVAFDAGEDLVKSALCVLPKPDSADFADVQTRRTVGRGQECLPPLADLAAKHILPVKKADILPVGLSEEAYALAFLKEFGLKSLDDSTLFRLPWLRTPLLISKQLLLTKATGKLKTDKSGRGPYMRLMAQSIKNPYEVWQVPMRLSGKVHITLRFLRLFKGEDGGFGGYSAFNWIGGGRYWSGATTFKAKNDFQRAAEYLEQQRNGILLFREGGGGVLQK
ncbi:phage minor head protein [uncultured Bilophila sp.]|uniref:phage minor head protein n=1 Tax=uncultured Bilophila sp. TaxID=529385 RepID=UPI0025952471|nr:phage minor head protein [uncultured Bilophila sp.]